MIISTAAKNPRWSQRLFKHHKFPAALKNMHLHLSPKPCKVRGRLFAANPKQKTFSANKYIKQRYTQIFWIIQVPFLMVTGTQQRWLSWGCWDNPTVLTDLINVNLHKLGPVAKRFLSRHNYLGFRCLQQYLHSIQSITAMFFISRNRFINTTHTSIICHFS